jgi:hypothetical protein
MLFNQIVFINIVIGISDFILIIKFEIDNNNSEPDQNDEPQNIKGIL